MTTLANVFFTREGCLVLAVLIFAIGVYGVLARRNLLVVLMALELMLNAVNLALLTFNHFGPWPREDGHLFALFVIAVAAAEAAVGLALLVALFRARDTVDTDAIRELAG